ncbi:MAG: 3-isopropylmalate dehydratase small subunit [Synechococcus sp. Tobar2m-G35]|nr:3-isopropylmalate dehydratase small subunit [Synechococcus sp. Tobar2m-G35]
MDFPSGPIPLVTGTALALPGDDIDTDRIIPARFLKGVSFAGLGEQVFADDRRELAGSHPFDRPEHRNARLLLVNGNFGCGSSREHAPQALMRWGIRALVGESFAEIFFGNCLALGLPCLQAPRAVVQELQALAKATPSTPWELDMADLALRQGDRRWPLTLADGPREMLLSGRWDATGQLLSNDAQLQATAARLPYLSGFCA